MPRQRLRAPLLLPLFLLSTSACIPTIKSVFIDMSYPKDAPESAARDVTRAVDTIVSPMVFVAYEHPQQAGQCLAELAADANNLRAMWSYGQCLTTGGTRADCVAKLPFVSPADASSPGPFALRFHCSAPPATESDKLELALSLDDASVAMVSYAMGAAGPGAVHGPLPAALEAPFGRALAHGASVLKADPQEAHNTNLPALSLSG